MIQTTSEIRVRYAETDAMGIVHHGNYFAWFETGRVHMLDVIGLPYADLEKMGFRLPVLEAHVNYKSPTRFDDRVQITTILKELPKVRMRIDYELRCQERLVCTAYTMHAFVNLKNEVSRPSSELVNKIKAAWLTGS